MKNREGELAKPGVLEKLQAPAPTFAEAIQKYSDESQEAIGKTRLKCLPRSLQPALQSRAGRPSRAPTGCSSPKTSPTSARRLIDSLLTVTEDRRLAPLRLAPPSMFTPPDWVSAVIQWTSLSNIADLVSLFGFAMTIWLVRQTNQLRRTLAMRSRVPEIRKKLEANNKQFPEAITNRLQDKKNFHQITGSTIALLQSLNRKKARSDGIETKSIIRKLQQSRDIFTFWKKPELDEEELWKIFGLLQLLVGQLIEFEKDMPYHE
ncbi:hypothetical protein D3C86_1377200 [compost metagenome]